MPQNLSPEMQQCIENCQNCHATCLTMLTNHCLEVGGAHLEKEHVRLMMDCIQICQASADFMLRQSKHHAHICKECAEICQQCADSCEKVGGMDECVQACRACVGTCGSMASA